MTSSQMYSLENPQSWIVIQRKETKKGCSLLVFWGLQWPAKMGPKWNGYRTRARAGLLCLSIQTVILFIPLLPSFPGPQAPHEYQSYASQTPRGINHLKDELIISELLRHAEGQADKFSLHSGEVFLWLGDQVDDKFRSLQGSRWRDRSFLCEQEHSVINIKPPVEKSSSVKRDPYLPT